MHSFSVSGIDFNPNSAIASGVAYEIPVKMYNMSYNILSGAGHSTNTCVSRRQGPSLVLQLSHSPQWEMWAVYPVRKIMSSSYEPTPPYLILLWTLRLIRGGLNDNQIVHLGS